jgi:hypothetical protein
VREGALHLVLRGNAICQLAAEFLKNHVIGRHDADCSASREVVPSGKSEGLQPRSIRILVRCG